MSAESEPALQSFSDGGISLEQRTEVGLALRSLDVGGSLLACLELVEWACPLVAQREAPSLSFVPA